MVDETESMVVILLALIPKKEKEKREGLYQRE